MWTKTQTQSSKSKATSGFTIVELLIVIVVIGILAAISIVAYSGIQGRARDTERVSDIGTIKKALEIHYVEYGFYPNATQMSNATYRKDVLKLPEAAVRPPGTANPIGYCWSAIPDSYCYVPYRPIGSPAGDCTGGVDPLEKCVGYGLSYRKEQTPDTQIRVSNG